MGGGRSEIATNLSEFGLANPGSCATAATKPAAALAPHVDGLEIQPVTQGVGRCFLRSARGEGPIGPVGGEEVVAGGDEGGGRRARAAAGGRREIERAHQRLHAVGACREHPREARPEARRRGEAQRGELLALVHRLGDEHPSVAARRAVDRAA